MTVNLPGLPTELLLKTVECMPTGRRFEARERRKLFAALRATCREINAKTAYYFGSTYYKNLTVWLDSAGPRGMQRLQTISKWDIAVHVRSIMVEPFPLVRYREFISDDESTDSVCSRLESDHERHSGKPSVRLISDEDVLKFLMDGTCGDMFSDCLSRLTNVEEFGIDQPVFNDEMRDDKIRLLELRWSTAIIILLSVALPRISNLNALYIKGNRYLAEGNEDRGKLLHCSLSLLPVLSSCSRYASQMTTLSLNLSTKASELGLQHYAYNLASICNKAGGLRNLHLALDKTDNSHHFFKHFSKKVDLTGLQYLTLRDIITRTKYLKLCLEPTIGSLKSIKLEHIELSTGKWNPMIWFLTDIRLKEVELRCLNWNEGDQSYGISFTKIHKQRPESFPDAECPLDGEDWQKLYTPREPYSWIRLSAQEGDQISHWLYNIEHNYKTCGAWEHLDWNLRDER